MTTPVPASVPEVPPSAAPQRYRHRRGLSLPASLEALRPDAAGIDVGAERHYVSVPEDRDPEPVRSFGCYTPELKRLAEWLVACGIRTVALESTGVYWIPLFRMLEEHGLEVVLVDARHVTYVPGRKSDVSDCQWLRRLHTYGLLRGAFVPEAEVAAMRAYWRQRKNLVEAAVREVLHMQKALTQMNLHLHVALSDLTGVSGLRILRAIVAGERDAGVLAQLAHPTVKCPRETLEAALTGHYTEPEVFALTQALSLYDTFAAKIAECDQALETHLRRFPDAPVPAAPAPPNSSKRHKRQRRKNEPHFDLVQELVRLTGVDLTRLDGLDAMTVFTVLSEIGLDASAFPTVKHFVSWLGLCPAHAITGGKVKKRRTKPVRNRAADALRVAAQSLHRSDSYLGACYRRLRARLGAPKAITAMAHKLARLFYALLKHGQAYVDKGQAYLEAQHRERTIKSLLRRAQDLSLTLEIVDLVTGEVIAPA